ncbi:hypothetical protein [Brevundimonas sp.]|uniref:hypothetical protein n=1 Tax=Brevundimonas sp. TaxID=1871086 RepID=UPI0025DC91A7|nr:hypothetical protein [Brevundimonas sp.]
MIFALVTSLGLALGQPAAACFVEAPTVLEDVRLADVVVVGRVTEYSIIRPLRSARLPRYARIELQVDEVLVGDAPETLTMTWVNSTFGIPEAIGEGPFLIALRAPTSDAPPLRGPSATIFPTPEPELLTILQAPCAQPFLFDASSEESEVVRLLLDDRP